MDAKELVFEKYKNLKRQVELLGVEDKHKVNYEVYPATAVNIEQTGFKTLVLSVSLLYLLCCKRDIFYILISLE